MTLHAPLSTSLCFDKPHDLPKLTLFLLCTGSFAGGFLLGVATLHLVSTGFYHVSYSADEFSSALPFALAVVIALMVDEAVRHSAYRWLPTEEQLKPSCFGEVMFPMLFDGSSDFLSGALLFLGLTLQYLFAGVTVGKITTTTHSFDCVSVHNRRMKLN